MLSSAALSTTRGAIFRVILARTLPLLSENGKQIIKGRRP
jgi:hypothetical protein